MKFNLQSIIQIVDNGRDVIVRFPFALLSALTGTVVGIILIHVDDPSCYPNILLTLVLAFPLFVAIGMYGEQNNWIKNRKIIVKSLAVVFLIIYYLLLPDSLIDAEEMFLIRYLMWAIGFTLLLTFVSFLKRHEDKVIISFWHYNRILFFSFVLTIIWALAIQAGLSIAMASVDYLFNLNIEEDRYLELWIVIVGLFSTTFFLSRVPKEAKDFCDTDDYPKELRLFSQYVLVPLVIIYFLILYSYVIRILALWEWPKGVLAYMILGFSFVGVLTYVSLYPLREKLNWVKKAGNIFFMILVPQIGMLFWALWFRISQYAFTEKRYFVFVFGWWLLVMAIYFLRSKKKDIRIIPITIFIIALMTSFGPWGAFSVSERSQFNRLEEILARNNLLVEGMVVEVTNEMSFEDRKEISAIIRYLIETHGIKSVQKIFKENLSEIEAKDDPDCYGRRCVLYTVPEKIVEDIIGEEYVEEWVVLNREDKNFYLYTDFNLEPYDISEYDYFTTLHSLSRDIVEKEGDIFSFELDNETGDIIFTKNDEAIARTGFRDFLLDLINNSRQSNLEREVMKFEHENENIKFVLYFNSINGEMTKHGSLTLRDILSIDAMLLYSFI